MRPRISYHARLYVPYLRTFRLSKLSSRFPLECSATKRAKRCQFIGYIAPCFLACDVFVNVSSALLRSLISWPSCHYCLIMVCLLLQRSKSSFFTSSQCFSLFQYTPCALALLRMITRHSKPTPALLLFVRSLLHHINKLW